MRIGKLSVGEIKFIGLPVHQFDELNGVHVGVVVGEV